ncbi:MAG: methyltransferase domain-containing protein [Gammaproteobacteria bacterium]|nr:methyltransferase domain-containing protein [Gammaproteobacteria bacterium]
MSLTKDIRRLVARLPVPARHRCVICGHRIGRFLPYRGGLHGSPPLMRALGIIGSDIDNFECPRCGAHDRERHLVLYLEASGLLARLPGMRILHFAPERHLAVLIAALAPVEYRKCDLYPCAEDVEQMNIEHIPFPDHSFDMVIANHVLEHVGDDRRALAEIHRVLQAGGVAVLQTPYSPVLHRTWSDPGITQEDARLQAYGQEDHVRLYGRDIFERFASCGFESGVRAHHELLAHKDAGEFGLNPEEPFFLFQRLR